MYLLKAFKKIKLSLVLAKLKAFAFPNQNLILLQSSLGSRFICNRNTIKVSLNS